MSASSAATQLSVVGRWAALDLRDQTAAKVCYGKARRCCSPTGRAVRRCRRLWREAGRPLGYTQLGSWGGVGAVDGRRRGRVRDALTWLHAARPRQVLTTRCRRSWRSSGSRWPRGSGVVHRVRGALTPATASRRCADRNRCWYALSDTPSQVTNGRCETQSARSDYTSRRMITRCRSWTTA